ncbi:MAG: SURF1 family protein [Betaproteobacteria bacterium]|nr:MAG: SURF1 family protein [Betaproteobacteria bacterium]
MKSKTFGPGWVPTVVALIGLALTLSASYWQFGRAASKAESRQQYLARQAMAPHDLNDSVPDNDAVAYRKVRVTGNYVQDKAILLDNRIRAGAAGYEIVVPLQISGTSRFVLINRGWVAAGHDRTVLPAINVPNAKVPVTGTAVAPGRGALELSEHTIEGQVWQNLDLAHYRDRQQLDVLDFVIQEESDRDDGIRRDWAAPGFGIETHQSYAVQWLLFASLIVFFYIYYGFIRKKPERQT